VDAGNIISTVLSIGAILSSAYLWVLEKRRQAPRLTASWSGRAFHWLDSWDTEPDGLVHHRFELEVFVANLSALPDVLLDLRFRVKSRDGWLPARWHGPVDTKSDHTYLPLNLTPRCTEPVYVLLEVATRSGATDDLESYLATPTMQLEVEAIGLDNHGHRALAVEPLPEER
jgi:hypothetical protein